MDVTGSILNIRTGGVSMPENNMVRLPEVIPFAGANGTGKFMQYDMGYGDYTKEKQEQPDMSLEEIDMLLNNTDN